MNFQRCCDVLDLTPPVTLPALKAAYKDLVQVWHPDRFSHNARLQQRAEEKLKTINLAYDTLEQFLLDQEARSIAARASQSTDTAKTRSSQSRSASHSARQSGSEANSGASSGASSERENSGSSYSSAAAGASTRASQDGRDGFAWTVASAYHNAMNRLQRKGILGWFNQLSLVNQARLYGVLVAPAVIFGLVLMLFFASILSAYPVLVVVISSAIALYVFLRKLSDYTAR